MRKTLRAIAIPCLLALAPGTLALCVPAGAAAAVSPLPESDYAVRPTCAAPGPGEAGCLALELVPQTREAEARKHPLGITRSTAIRTVSAAEGSFGLRPQDLHSAYQIPTTAPSAQTIAIVDAYNDLSAEADLEAYDHEFGLPECSTENGCFQQVNENGEAGSSNLPFPQTEGALEHEEAVCNTTKAGETTQEREARKAACAEVKEAKGWAGEISLDVEVAHATCQNCRIALVEASSPSYSDLEAAEEAAAVKLGATEISNSWGGQPFGDSSAFNHPGTVITAAAGDTGYLNWDARNSFERGYANYPASSPHVVAVGGTHLYPLGSGGAWAGETVWNGHGAGGGGCSATFEAQPWQVGLAHWGSVGCGTHRAVADVSADADPYTGVAVYDSYAECTYEQGGVTHTTHWCTVGGTSLSSPLIASVFALAGGAHGVGYPAETLYESAAKAPGTLHDIASGSNGACGKPPKAGGLSGCTTSEEQASCASTLICLAATGYDGPSGVGTPNGLTAFAPGAEEASKSTGRGEPQPEGPTGGGTGTQGVNAGNGATTGGSSSGTASPAASTIESPAFA